MTDLSIARRKLRRFLNLFLNCNAVWLQLDEVVVVVIELEMRPKSVQKCDEELMSIVLLVVSEVTRGGPNGTKNLRRYSSGYLCSISSPISLEGDTGRGEGGRGGGGGEVAVPREFIHHFKEFRKLTEEAKLLLLGRLTRSFAVVYKKFREVKESDEDGIGEKDLKHTAQEASAAHVHEADDALVFELRRGIGEGSELIEEGGVLIIRAECAIQFIANRMGEEIKRMRTTCTSSILLLRGRGMQFHVRESMKDFLTMKTDPFRS